MANAMVPQAEPKMYAREQRITKGGRHLWYQLEVLQQPERARACGSGPKCMDNSDYSECRIANLD